MHPPAADDLAAIPSAAGCRAPLARRASTGARGLAVLSAATLLLLGCPSEKSSPPSGGGPLLPEIAEADSAKAPRFTRLSLEVEGQTTTLERRTSGWWLTSPVEFPADPVAVDELLSALRRGSLRERIAETPDPETLRELGLSPPRLRLVAEVGDGRQQVLEAGVERAFDGSVPVRRGGASEVHAASGHLRRVLERDAGALRAKRLFPFRPEEVAQVSMRSATSGWNLERDSQGWKQTQEPTFEADPDRVNLLLRRLVAVQARSFAPDDPATAKPRGLSPPGWVLELRPTSGASTRVELSTEPVGDERTLWVRWHVPDAQSTLAKVDARLLELARTDPLSLRSTRLLRFEADAVAAIELVYADGSQLLLERAPEDETTEAGSKRAWSVVRDGERSDLSSHRVAALLWNLAQLRAQSPRDPQVDPLRPPPEGLVTIRLMDGAGEVLGRVGFGGLDPSDETRVAVSTDAIHAFASSEVVAALRQATRSDGFGPGQTEDGAEGASSPKKGP